jgi:hypothetical protein
MSGAPFDGTTIELNYISEQLKIDHITGGARVGGNITIKPYPRSEKLAKIVSDAASGRVRVCQSGGEYGLGGC